MNNWDALVESTITAIYFDPLKKEIRIEVVCVWDDKKRKQIAVTGVDDFVINEMRISNIIDRVNIFSADNIHDRESDLMDSLFFLMRGVEPSPSDLEWPALKDKVMQIRNGDFALMEIEPVYGARAIILANSLRLENLD
jgi:hypothetical protein